MNNKIIHNIYLILIILNQIFFQLFSFFQHFWILLFHYFIQEIPLSYMLYKTL